MADEVDLTSETEDRILEYRTAAIRAAAKERELPATGQCHNCEHVFGPDIEDRAVRLFCDDDCRIDWEKRCKPRLY